MFTIEGLDHVAMRVRDVERSVAWYEETLGFERLYDAWGNNPAVVGAGGSGLALFQVAGDGIEPEYTTETLNLIHVAFRVNYPGFEQAQERLRDRKIAFHLEDHGISHSIYFTDPDGHRLEITTYDLANANG